MWIVVHQTCLQGCESKRQVCVLYVCVRDWSLRLSQCRFIGWTHNIVTIFSLMLSGCDNSFGDTLWGWSLWPRVTVNLATHVSLHCLFVVSLTENKLKAIHSWTSWYIKHTTASYVKSSVFLDTLYKYKVYQNVWVCWL